MISTRLLAGLLAGGILAACSRDPNILKQQDVERGDAFFKERKYAEAVIEYSRAIQRDPNFSAGYERLGRLHLEEGNGAKAWQSYQRAASLAPADLELQVKAGGVMLAVGRFEDAQRLAEGVLEKNPRHVGGLVLRANALVGLEGSDRALTLLEDAVRLAPEAGDLYSNLGSLQATAGHIEEAERTYKRAIAVAPALATSYVPLGNFYWATGRLRDADAMFSKAVEVEPSSVLGHRARATFYLGTGQPLKAEASMKFMATATGKVEHKIALGDYYIVIGRPEEGVSILQQAAAEPAGENPANTRLAAAAFAAGQQARARAAIDAVLAKAPDFAPALLLKARFLLAAGDSAEALSLATRAATLQADYTEALFFAAKLHAEAGDSFQALEAYKKIVEINPMARVAQVQLARAMYARGEVDASREYLGTIIRDVSTDDLSARLAIVSALLERREVRAAEDQLLGLLKQHKDRPAVQSMMGTLSALKGNERAARDWFERALQAEPMRITAIAGLVGLDVQARRFAEARRRAEAAVTAAPRQGDPLILLAQTYGAINEPKLAEQTLRKAIEIAPNSFDAYGMLGQLLYEQGRLAEGRAEFEKLAKARPRSVGAHTMIAIILRSEGRTNDAIQEYKKALAIDSQAAVAANNLAWIYQEQTQNLDEAVELAKLARKLLPDSPDVADTLGWVYYRHGHPDLLRLSVPVLEEAVRRAPNNAQFRYHLGAAYAKSSKPAEARRELTEALRLSADFPGSTESRRLLASLR